MTGFVVSVTEKDKHVKVTFEFDTDADEVQCRQIQENMSVQIETLNDELGQKYWNVTESIEFSPTKEDLKSELLRIQSVMDGQTVTEETQLVYEMLTRLTNKL